MFLGVCTRGGLTSVQGQGARFRLTIVCQVLEQRQDTACFSAGTQCGLRSVCQGLEQGQEPAWISAGTEMQVQECLPGD